MSRTPSEGMLPKTGRALRISATLLKYFVFYRFTSRRHDILGKRMRLACEELGPTFIKMGQILSLRYDLISEEDGKELQKLLDQVPEIPYWRVCEIIEHDFGKHPDELFLHFPRKPIASASVSQVYKAKLHSGDTVAVKVRRPFIGRKIENDIALFRIIARICKPFSKILRRMDIGGFTRELETWLLQEIDFRHEARNIETVRKHYAFAQKPFRKDLGIGIFPQLYPELSSANVITTEFIDGVPLTKAHAIKDNPEYDIEKSVLTYFNAGVRYYFIADTYVFNGDPHPANIIIMKHGNVGHVDAGLLGQFTAEQTTALRELMITMYAQDTEGFTRAIVSICDADYETYAPKIRADVERLLATFKSKGVGFFLIGIGKLALKHKMKLPYEVSLLGRSHLVCDGLLHHVNPGLSTEDALGEECRRAIKERMKRNLVETDYGPVLYNISKKFKESPALVNKIIDRYYDDPLQLVRDFRRAAHAEPR